MLLWTTTPAKPSIANGCLSNKVCKDPLTILTCPALSSLWDSFRDYLNERGGRRHPPPTRLPPCSPDTLSEPDWKTEEDLDLCQYWVDSHSHWVTADGWLVGPTPTSTILMSFMGFLAVRRKERMRCRKLKMMVTILITVLELSVLACGNCPKFHLTHH